MASLPKRPGPYVVALLLILLGALTWWVLQALDDPAVRRAAQAARVRANPAPDPSLALPLPLPTATQDAPTDPAIVEMHDEMVRPDTTPEREAEIVQELIFQNQKALGAGSFGDNNDITRSLVGDSAHGVWLPRQSPRIRDGQLLDRWGTPYWFHSNASNQIEIRSAGPDKNLFTTDDIILNESPSGLGATPEEVPIPDPQAQ